MEKIGEMGEGRGERTSKMTLKRAVSLAFIPAVNQFRIFAKIRLFSSDEILLINTCVSKDHGGKRGKVRPQSEFSGIASNTSQQK